MVDQLPKTKVTLADALKFIQSKGYKPEALVRFKKKQSAGLSATAYQRGQP